MLDEEFVFNSPLIWSVRRMDKSWFRLSGQTDSLLHLAIFRSESFAEGRSSLIQVKSRILS